MAVIEVERVSKVFPLRRAPRAFFSNKGIRRMFTRPPRETFEALHDVSFTLEAGHSLGIIGANGSGKSTLLKILAGVTVPTSGDVRIYGRVASLLELGAGFHPLLTGRENVYLNAGILGLSQKETERIFDDIVAFSGIGEFIDNPVETYSSGMYIRIGFSVAVHANPDLFLVDEVLSVGDEEFQRKCRVRIGELKEQGKTIVFVSHDLSIVNTLCDRVILLSKGRMVQRDTPKETIDFYLRQVGQERSIHTMSVGDLEVIFSHGRVSVFHRKHEVSAPSGFSMHLLSMEQWHQSVSADWTVTERSPDRCVARGRMARLPLTVIWELRLDRGQIVWTISLDCERESPVDHLDVQLFFPPSYTRWQYGDMLGRFPEILPGDLAWSVIVPADASCSVATAIPEVDVLPPVLIHPDFRKRYLRFEWRNSDYILGSRVLNVGARLPQSDTPLPAGPNELMTLTLDLNMTIAEVEAQAKVLEAERTVASGALSAALERGHVRLLYDGVEFSSFVHLYTSMLIGNLWNDSQNLQWQRPVREGGRVTAVGESRRFPYRQQWELEAEEEGVVFRVWLEAWEPLEVSEYHASIGLLPGYERWETPFEAGEFKAFDSNQHDWRHLNRDYAQGSWAKATGAALPSVTLEVTSTEPSFRMTALNTGVLQNARVLQALRTPDHGTMRFEPGRYLYFEGRIRVTPARSGMV